MINKEQLTSICKHVLKHEYAILGDDHFNECLLSTLENRDCNFMRPRMGSAMEINSIIEATITVAEFVVAMYGVYELLKSKGKKSFKEENDKIQSESKYKTIDNEVKITIESRIKIELDIKNNE